MADGDEPASAGADDGDGWSDPIYFYADGTTSDARLTLAGEGRDTSVSWLCDIGQHAGRGPASTGQARVLLLLRNTAGPLTAQQIAQRTSITYPTVRVLLHRLNTGHWTGSATNPGNLNKKAAALGPKFNIFESNGQVVPTAPAFTPFSPAPYLRPFSLGNPIP